jgi:fatty acid desaturase
MSESFSHSAVGTSNGKQDQRGLKGLFTPAEIANVTARSDLMGAWVLFGNWLAIAACFWAMAHFDSVWVYVLGTCLIAGRQLGLGILQHEGAHGTLFKTRWLNDVLTDWLCARPVWQHLHKYRKHHIKHHTNTGLDADPDISLHAEFPVSKFSMTRKLLRDVSGLTGLKTMVALLMMDLGLIEWTVANKAHHISQRGRPWWDYPRSLLRNIYGMLITNAALFSVLYASGHPELYAFWVLAFLTALPLFIRIRSIAEHGCMQRGPNVLTNTRTTRANWLARITVAPHHVNFHKEHHLMASVPCYRLPQLHTLLRKKGLVNEPESYWDVIKLASGKPVNGAA